MILINGLQQADDEEVYQSELVAYNDENKKYTIKLIKYSNDLVDYPTYYVILNEEELVELNKKNNIRYAYEFAQKISDGSVPVMVTFKMSFEKGLRLKSTNCFIDFERSGLKLYLSIAHRDNLMVEEDIYYNEFNCQTLIFVSDDIEEFNRKCSDPTYLADVIYDQDDFRTRIKNKLFDIIDQRGQNVIMTENGYRIFCKSTSYLVCDVKNTREEHLLIPGETDGVEVKQLNFNTNALKAIEGRNVIINTTRRKDWEDHRYVNSRIKVIDDSTLCITTDTSDEIVERFNASKLFNDYSHFTILTVEYK